MSEEAELTRRVEAAFEHIARTRMAGLAVVNPALSVSLRGLRRLGGHWVGVLVTPWFMNVMLLPAVPDMPARRIGEKRQESLPSGRYEMIWGHEEAIGGFWSCSLFSPMGAFADQATAEATADAALVELLAAPPAEEAPAPKPAGLSRRGLLGLGADRESAA